MNPPSPVVRSLKILAGRERQAVFGHWSPTGAPETQHYPSASTDSTFAAWASYRPDSATPLIRHTCEELVVALRGDGLILLAEGKQVGLAEWDVALIPAGMWHGMAAGPSGLDVVFCFPASAYPPTESHDAEVTP